MNLPNQNTEGLYVDNRNHVIDFQFISVEDYGSTACPHCGAEGRYIYTWIQDGCMHSAMAGCYKALTGRVSKNEKEQYFELLSEKQAKGKKLNGWDKTIIRLLQFKKEGKYPDSWCDDKISQALSQRKKYLSKF